MAMFSIFKDLIKTRSTNQSHYYENPLWQRGGGAKVCINSPDHLTKMAPSKMVKPLKESSSEPEVQ